MQPWNRPPGTPAGRPRATRRAVLAQPALAPLALACAAMLVLSGCSAGGQSGQNPVGQNPAAPAPATPGPGNRTAPPSSGPAPGQEQRDRQGTDNSPVDPRSDFQLPDAGGAPRPDQRGLLQKRLGELSGVVTADGSNKRLVNFTVASITVDYSCQTGTAIKPTNGHFIAVELWIEALPGLAASKDPFFSVSPKDFDLQGPDGRKVSQSLDTRAGHVCLDNGLGLPARVLPGQKIRGLVVLDSPIDAGSLVLSQKSTDGPGWLWPLPAPAAPAPKTG